MSIIVYNGGWLVGGWLDQGIRRAAASHIPWRALFSYVSCYFLLNCAGQNDMSAFIFPPCQFA